MKLRKAININNKPVNELDLDVEKITPQIIIDAENALAGRKPLMLLPEFDKEYLINIAGLILHVPAEALMSLHVRDFMQICNEIRNFLLGTESQELTQKSNANSES